MKAGALRRIPAILLSCFYPESAAREALRSSLASLAKLPVICSKGNLSFRTIKENAIQVRQQENYLIVVAGPTAVGKTECCVKLAEALGTEIVSADSRQFFRELNIGTAKPSETDLGRIRHHFINSHSITETYSAGDFERDILDLLPLLFKKRNIVIMTGGSGLYIKAVCEGLDDLPRPQEGLREALTEQWKNGGFVQLQDEIRQWDPEFAESAGIHNPQRVIRALEVFHTTGSTISSFRKGMQAKRPFRQVLIALERDRKELYARINQRADLMVRDGLVDEAKAFYDYRQHHALQTVGYKEVYGYLDGLYDAEEMLRLIKQNTRRYAKRQLTWFRHQGDYTWFHPDDLDGMLLLIRSRLGA